MTPSTLRRAATSLLTGVALTLSLACGDGGNGGSDSTDGDELSLADQFDGVYTMVSATESDGSCTGGEDALVESAFRLEIVDDTTNYYPCPTGADDCRDAANTLFEAEWNADEDAFFYEEFSADNLISGKDNSCRRTHITVEVKMLDDGNVRVRRETAVDDSQPAFQNDADCEATAEGWTGAGAVCIRRINRVGELTTGE